MHTYIAYNYNGIITRADVSLINRDFWIFRVNPENTTVFSLQFNSCKRIWKKGDNEPVDPILIEIIGAELMKIYGEEIRYTDPHYIFSTTDYFLCKNNGDDVIGFWDQALRIEVTRFLLKEFKPNINEIQFYGDDFGVPLAFETFGYNGEGKELILNAIKWYAEYIGYPNMEVKKEHPDIRRN